MTLRRCWFGIAFLGMLLALLPVQAHAQTGTATITGLVLDETGAAMPGVTVTATNQATNVTHVAVSNQAGNYTITPVVVGTYVIKAELAGFRHGDDCAGRSGSGTGCPARFQDGGRARRDRGGQRGAPILQTETTTVGEVISGNTVQSLPLNGRNTGQLTLLLPGTITYNPRGFTNIGSVNMNRPFVNGNREQTNNFTVDGLDVNETIDNRVAYQPVPDALAEISVETNNYGAEIGNVGGAVDQQRHQVRRQSVPRQRLRVLPEQRLRREYLGEQPFERRQAGTQTAHLRWHTRRSDRHATNCSSSPTIRGRGRTHRASATASVAPEAWRRGDFSCVTTPISDPQNGLPFPGNQIPIERFSPTARAILNDLVNYPLPNRQCPAGSLVITSARRCSRSARTRVTRASTGDISENDKFFGRYSFARYEDHRDEQAFPLFLSQPQRPAVLQHRLQLEPRDRILDDQRVARRLQQHECHSGNGRLGGHRRRKRDLRHRRRSADPRALAIRWGSGLTAPGCTATDSDTLAKTYQINEKLTWLRGRHAVKFGGQWLHYNQRRFYAGNNGRLGFITYTGALHRNGVLGLCTRSGGEKGRGGGDPTDPWTHLQNRISLFAQDDFKVTTNLTLNLGLRWAYTSPLVEKDNRQSNFDLATGAQIFAQDGSIEDRALYKPYYNGWEPRVGVAWSASDRLVVPRRLRYLAVHGGDGGQPAAAAQSAILYESFVAYDSRTGPGRTAPGFGSTKPDTERQRPRLRSRPPPAVHAPVERVCGVSADRGNVGAGRIRRSPSGPSGDADRGKPGSAWCRGSRNVGSEKHASAALRCPATGQHNRHDDLTLRQRIQLAAGQRSSAPA